MRPKSLLGLIAGVALPIQSWAAAGGTSGGNVLAIDVGARAVGMGEAYTAQADDSASLYWNPAGLGLTEQGDATFMYAQWLKDLTYQNIRAAVPMKWGGLGASLSYLSYGQIDGYNDQNIATGDVRAYSGVATVGGALNLDRVSLGLGLKALQGDLADVKAHAFAADLGATYVHPEKILSGDFRLAATLRNLGTGIKYLNQSDPLPREWRLGAALVHMMDRRLNASFDFGQQRDSRPALYGGAEYWIIPMVALRAGYSGAQTESNGLRLGLGLKVKDFSFDYAYGSYGDLGATHRYEISFRFGSREQKSALHKPVTAAAPPSAPALMADLASVHFDLDQDRLSPAAKKILRTNFEALQQHSNWAILIEGFCDERGSEEYNLQLGRRRVAAVRDYYLSLGLDTNRMDSVSHGKNDPTCTEHNDDCWSQNRRSFTRVRLASTDGPVQVRYHEGVHGARADDETEANELEQLLKSEGMGTPVSAGPSTSVNAQ